MDSVGLADTHKWPK